MEGDKHMAAAGFAVEMPWVSLGGPILPFFILGWQTL